MTRWYSMLAGGIVLAAVVFLFGTHAVAFVKAGYPSDTIRREALARCAAADTHFLRFSAKDRIDCYKTAHLDGETGVMVGFTVALLSSFPRRRSSAGWRWDPRPPLIFVI